VAHSICSRACNYCGEHARKCLARNCSLNNCYGLNLRNLRASAHNRSSHGAYNVYIAWYFEAYHGHTKDENLLKTMTLRCCNYLRICMGWSARILRPKFIIESVDIFSESNHGKRLKGQAIRFQKRFINKVTKQYNWYFLQKQLLL